VRKSGTDEISVRCVMSFTRQIASPQLVTDTITSVSSQKYVETNLLWSASY
jgi:hypothetical protein